MVQLLFQTNGKTIQLTAKHLYKGYLRGFSYILADLLGRFSWSQNVYLVWAGAATAPPVDQTPHLTYCRFLSEYLCDTYCGNSAGCSPRLEDVADYWSKLEYVTPTEEGSSLRHRPAHLSPKDRSHFKSGVLELRAVEDTYPWPYWDAANLALRVSCHLVTGRMRLASRESRRL